MSNNSRRRYSRRNAARTAIVLSNRSSQNNSRGNTGSVENDIHAIAASVTNSNPMGSIDSFVFPRADLFENEVYNCFDTCEFSNTFIIGGGGPTFGAFGFTGAAFNGFSDMSQAFDSYRIKSVECYWYPNLTTAFANTGSMFTTVLDFNDSIVPGTIGQLLSYSSAVTTPATSIQRRSFKPRTELVASNLAGAATNGATVEDQWLDTSAGTVAQYGLKYGATVAAVSGSYNLVVRAHFQYKNSR